MKTITFNNKIKSVLKLAAFRLLTLLSVCSYGQFQNNAQLYVDNGGIVYVGAGAYNFGVSGQSITSRSTAIYGQLVFGATATSNGGADAHFLDGYGRVSRTAAFTLPIGQSGVYAPAQIIPTTLAPIDGAYYRSSPSAIGTARDVSVRLVSAVEYWNIQGANTAVVSLTWRANSMLSTMALSTSDLVLAGYDGAKWVALPALVDATSILGGVSTLNAGSISSTVAINLNTYKFFTIGVKGESCNPLIASSGITKTWSGSSWTPSAPSLADPAVINSAYNAGSFACNSLVLNADVTLTDGQNVEIINQVTGAAKFIMSSEASLIQRATGVSAPNIELTKRTRSMRRYDYVYFGAPITTNAFSQLAAARASTAALSNAFDFVYKYNTGAGGGWQALSTTEAGKGFIARVKQQNPFSNATNTDFINLKFTGVANNGDISIPITNNAALPNSGLSHVLLSNPYPSAIDAYVFLKNNTDIDGVVYLWSAATSNNGGTQYYAQADYIAYTLAGTVSPSNIPATFNGKIASGQGFKVKSLTNSGTVTFTNCMRLIDNNNQFSKSADPIVTSKANDSFKLNMTGNNGVFSQILIAYLPEATSGYDRMYDAGRNSVSTAQLFSVFEPDGRKLAINARPTFDAADRVPLGVTKSGTNTENFTISIAEKEGLFSDSDVNVYLHDIDNNIYHDLNSGDFTFKTNQTAVLGRYEIVYQRVALSNVAYQSQGLQAILKNNAINLTANQEMVSIEVYDITGRKIFNAAVDNASAFYAPFYYPTAVYVAKVKFADGTLANIKLINQK